ncbi:MAG TPA: hemerythrin domain-containing protein [Sphingomonas sp.]|jgi:hemerythrin-like domain-containing protein|nr:hemerythrin domain-containing protein [Sphingomonas sp.]
MADDRIFAELKRDHDRHRDLLERIASADPDSKDRAALFEQLRVELQAHAAAEEESLYATMLARPDLRDEARHSVSEHKEIDDFLGELVEADPSSDKWAKTFKELRHRYLHHIDEEEEEMFPAASKDLDDATKARLAAVFEKRKPKELARAEDEMPGDARE